MRVTIPIFVLLLATSVVCKPKPVVRQPIEHHQLTLQFDVENHRLEGTARLTLPRKGVKVAGFLLGQDFSISDAILGGVPVKLKSRVVEDPEMISPEYGVFGEWDTGNALLWTTETSKEARRKELNNAFKAKPLILQVDFSGSLYVPPDNRQFSREKIAFEVDGTIGHEGIFLSPTAYWYPTLPDVLSTYEVTVKLPEGWNCVTDGMPGGAIERDGWVEVTYVSDVVTGALSFSAGPFVVEKLDHNGIAVMTYFLPEQAGLSEGYIEACTRYVDMYSDLIAPYPFSKFAVVDNFLPSGYGMPGWTLLGSEVLRLPFIKGTSLGHEITHNWIGNSLLVDYREGNWCEGLTVYLADYKYKEDADSLAAMEYRMNQLRDFAAYVNSDNDYPVTEFVSRSGPADRAIGYGKVMMIFHMLRKMLDQYDEAIFMQVISETYYKYQWQPIGWKEWQKEFERRLGQKLGWFFDQWLLNPGAPELAVENMVIENVKGGWEAKFEVVTKTFGDKPYKYLLPIRILSDRGSVNQQAFIQSSRQSIKLAGGGEIRSLQLDPGFDVFRRIYTGEMPLTLAEFFGDPDGILVIPSKDAKVDEYKRIAENLKSDGQRIVTDTEFTAEMENNSLWLFGDPEINCLFTLFPMDSSRLEYLPLRAPRWREDQPLPAGLVFKREEFHGGELIATLIDRHPKDAEKSIVYTLALPTADLVDGTRKLQHYGKYSYLLFEGDQNIRKGEWVVSGESPVAWRNKSAGK